MNKVAKIFSYIAFVFAFCFMAIGYAAVQDTLTVSGTISVEVQNQPFAVYGPVSDSEGQFVENALNFYNRAAVEVGDEITLGEGSQRVEAIYTDFDRLTYADQTYQPWSANRANIGSVAVIDDGIQPIDMSYWFYGFTSCISFDLAKLDTSEVHGDNLMSGGMDYVFYNCSSVVTLDISTFNVAKVTSVLEMFGECSNLKTIYASTDVNFDLARQYDRTTPVFKGCDSLVGGNETAYDESNATLEYARIDGLDGLPGYFTYNGYTLIFDAKEGVGAPSVMFSEIPTFTIPSATPNTDNGRDFLGWSTEEYAVTAEYAAGAEFTISGTALKDVLYAVYGNSTTTQAGIKDILYNEWNWDASGVYDLEIIISGGTWTDTIPPANNIACNNVNIGWGGITVDMPIFPDMLTINDGVFDGGLNISGGQSEGDHVEVRINGGTFNISAFVSNYTSVSIYGGKWTADSIDISGNEMTTIKIYGGEFKWNPEQYLADGYKAVYNVGTGFYDVVECETHSFDAFKDNGDDTHSKTCSVCNTVVSDDHDFAEGDCICGAPCTHPEFDGDSCTACGYTKIEPVEIPALGEDNADSDELFVNFNYYDPDSDITLSEMNVTSSDSGMYFMMTDATDNYSAQIRETWSDLQIEYPDQTEWMEKMFAGIQELGGTPISLKHWLNIENITMYENYRIRLMGYDAGADGDLTVEAAFPTIYGEGEPVVVVLSYIDGEYDGTTPVVLTHIALRATVNENGKVQFEVPAEQAELMTAGFMMLSVVTQNKD